MSAKDDLKTELAEKLKVAAELNVQASVPEAMDNLAEAIAEPVDAYTQEQIIIGVAGVNISETPNETKVTKTQTSEQLVDFKIGIDNNLKANIDSKLDSVINDGTLIGDGTGASPLGYIVKGGEGVGRSVPNGGEVFNSYYNPLAPEIENVASGDFSHAEGNTTKATGFCCHAEGVRTQATTNCAHAEGSECIASGSQSHAEGAWNVASGLAAHAEGYETKAEAIFSHAEGYGTQSFAEDEDAGIDGFCSHVEGYCSKTKGFFTHAEGSQCEAIGQSSHAEGFQCEAIGQSSHAEGSQCEAIGQSSHAEGIGSVANGYFQHVSGKYNVPDTTSAEIIGNGTDNENRSNARTLDWYGNETLAGDVIVKGNRNLRTELENESAQRMSADTALQNAIDTKEPAFSLLPISKGGTGATTAIGARTNLDVYSKAEVDALSNGKIVILQQLPPSGESNIIYFVGPTGSGDDQYKEYIWNSDTCQFVQVGDVSIDLSNYLNNVQVDGNGNAVTSFEKNGNTLVLNKETQFTTSSELNVEKGRIGALETSLTNEISARESADAALQASIDLKAPLKTTEQSADVTDSTKIYTTSTSGTNGTLYRRTSNALWNYIKNKISSVLGLTATQYNGNASTASGYTSGGAIYTALGSKQDTLSFDGTYDANTNKAATVASITSAMSWVDVPYTLARGWSTGTNEQTRLNIKCCPALKIIMMSGYVWRSSILGSGYNEFMTVSNPSGITIEKTLGDGVCAAVTDNGSILINQNQITVVSQPRNTGLFKLRANSTNTYGASFSNIFFYI